MNSRNSCHSGGTRGQEGCFQPALCPADGAGSPAILPLGPYVRCSGELPAWAAGSVGTAGVTLDFFFVAVTSRYVYLRPAPKLFKNYLWTLEGNVKVEEDLCFYLQVSSAQFRSPGGVGGSQECFERYLKCKPRFSKAHAEPFPGLWHRFSSSTLCLLMFPGHHKFCKAQNVLWRMTQSQCKVTSPVSGGY